jgi:hypothetical protein
MAVHESRLHAGIAVRRTPRRAPLAGFACASSKPQQGLSNEPLRALALRAFVVQTHQQYFHLAAIGYSVLLVIVVTKDGFMRKSLLTLSGLICLVGMASGQSLGRVTFANNAATAITNASGGGLPPYPAFTGRVGLYGSIGLGLPDDSALFPVGAPVNTYTPGLFSGGSRYIGGPGDRVTLQVRAWTGNYQTYESAFAAALAGDATVLLGKSPKWEQLTSGDTPTQPIIGQGRLTPFLVYPVPEPAAISLALLGLAAMRWRGRVGRK